MHRLSLAKLPFILLLLLVLPQARAQEPGSEAHRDPDAHRGPGPGLAVQLPEDSVTQHAITLGGQQLSYKATAGTLPIYGPKGELAAKVFYVSYTVEGAGVRPITFAFNGGPGSRRRFSAPGSAWPARRALPSQWRRTGNPCASRR